MSSLVLVSRLSPCRVLRSLTSPWQKWLLYDPRPHCLKPHPRNDSYRSIGPLPLSKEQNLWSHVGPERKTAQKNVWEERITLEILAPTARHSGRHRDTKRASGKGQTKRTASGLFCTHQILGQLLPGHTSHIGTERWHIGKMEAKVIPTTSTQATSKANCPQCLRFCPERENMFSILAVKSFFPRILKCHLLNGLSLNPSYCWEHLPWEVVRTGLGSWCFLSSL